MPFGEQSGEAVEGFFEQAEIGDGAHRLDLAGRVAAHQHQGEFVVAGKRTQRLRGGSAKADAGPVGAVVGAGRGAAGRSGENGSGGAARGPVRKAASGLSMVADRRGRFGG